MKYNPEDYLVEFLKREYSNSINSLKLLLFKLNIKEDGMNLHIVEDYSERAALTKIERGKENKPITVAVCLFVLYIFIVTVETYFDVKSFIQRKIRNVLSLIGRKWF